jgi:hypothetical protein
MALDPLSALIGGGSSIASSIINANEAGDINERNFGQQLFMAGGGYLPGLVSSANNAGLNPLAVLGMHAPTGGTAVPIGAGAGVAGAGKFLSDIKDQHTLTVEDLQEKSLRQDVLIKGQQMTQQEIDNAIRLKTLNDLHAGKTVSGPEPSLVRQVGENMTENSRGVIDRTLDTFKNLGSDWRSWTGADQETTPGYGNLGGYLDYIMGK